MKKRVVRIVWSIIFVGLFIFALQKVGVSKQKCVSQYGECPKEIQQIVEKHIGGSYFIARNSISEELGGTARVSYFRIRFVLPDVISVEITERKPEIAAKFAEDNYYLFDVNGMSLGNVGETALPVVVVYEVPPGERFAFGMRLARELDKYYEARELRLDKQGLYARVRGNVEAVLPLEGDADVVLGALEVVVSQLNRGLRDSTIALADGKNYRVDLRYKNPVVSQI